MFPSVTTALDQAIVQPVCSVKGKQRYLWSQPKDTPGTNGLMSKDTHNFLTILTFFRREWLLMAYFRTHLGGQWHWRLIASLYSSYPLYVTFLGGGLIYKLYCLWPHLFLFYYICIYYLNIMFQLSFGLFWILFLISFSFLLFSFS